LFLLLCLLRLHTSFTLFPYTTLFRSLSTNELVFIFADLPHRDRLYQSLYFNRLGKLLKGLLVKICTRLKRIHRDLTNLDKINTADRKSTRLNSSHVKISYAVFCLKKN